MCVCDHFSCIFYTLYKNRRKILLHAHDEYIVVVVILSPLSFASFTGDFLEITMCIHKFKSMSFAHAYMHYFYVSIELLSFYCCQRYSEAIQKNFPSSYKCSITQHHLQWQQQQQKFKIYDCITCNVLLCARTHENDSLAILFLFSTDSIYTEFKWIWTVYLLKIKIK